jgi:hypothetical protein
MTVLQAFARLVDSLFVKLGMAATFQPRIGPNLAVTVIPKRPDEIIGLGQSDIAADVTLFDLRTSEIAGPQEGDVLRYGGDDYRIIGTPRRDIHRLIWTVEAVKA